MRRNLCDHSEWPSYREDIPLTHTLSHTFSLQVHSLDRCEIHAYAFYLNAPRLLLSRSLFLFLCLFLSFFLFLSFSIFLTLSMSLFLCISFCLFLSFSLFLSMSLLFCLSPLCLSLSPFYFYPSLSVCLSLVLSLSFYLFLFSALSLSNFILPTPFPSSTFFFLVFPYYTTCRFNTSIIHIDRFIVCFPVSPNSSAKPVAV